MSAKRHDSDECLVAGIIAAGNSFQQSTQASHSRRVLFHAHCEFNHELER